jgi:diguanylate cyclase (GGDEF)-like protein
MKSSNSGKCVGGSATIDEQLKIKTADEDFFDFIGQNAVYTLAHSIHPSDLIRLENAISSIGIEKENVITLRMVRNDGQYRWMLVFINEHTGKLKGERYFDLNIQDVEDYRNTIASLKGSNQRYTEYFSLMEYLMVSYDVHTDKLRIFMVGSHQQVNFYHGTLTNFKNDKIVNKEVDYKYISVFERLCDDFYHGTPSFEHELKMKLLGDVNSMEWCVIKGKTIADSAGKKHVIATMSVVNPVSKTSGAPSIISGTRDAGTDLLNKRSITSYAQHILEASPLNPVTFIIIDIDNFKNINDHYGHMFGDQVIRDVADTIKESVEGKGIVGRIGGDEYFVILENLGSNEEKRSVLRTIRNNVSWLYKDHEDYPKITCSLGAANYPDDAVDYDSLFCIADKVLYLAKEKGKNRYVIYVPELHENYVKGGTLPEYEDAVMGKYRKVEMVNNVIIQFHKQGLKAFDEICKLIGQTFTIDSICIYDQIKDKNNWSRCVLYGSMKDSKYDGYYFEQDNYIANFTYNKVLAIDNINFFECVAQNVFKAFTDMGICQAVQIIIRDYENNLRIVSFNRIKQLKKWSDTDIMYLAILGNIVGMGYCDDKKNSEYISIT